MVAYSFNTAFVRFIADRSKRQTIRLPRKRHARPGERVQLFTGMRTKDCRKIIPDPFCIAVDDVRFDLRKASAVPAEIARTVSLEVNGIPLIGATADTYAVGDGFHGYHAAPGQPCERLGAFNVMAHWWYRVHGLTLFEGVAIRWEDRP